MKSSAMATVLWMLQKPNSSTKYPGSDACAAVNLGSATTDGAGLNSQGKLGTTGSSTPSSSVLMAAMAEARPPTPLPHHRSSGKCTNIPF